MACVIQDAFTEGLQAHPCKTKGAADTFRSFQKFLGPHIKAPHVYLDNSKDVAKASDEMCVCHDTCTPYILASNGIAERAVRRVKEGTSASLVQCGLSDRWWHKAMAAFCYLRSIHDIRPNDKTAYHTRHGEDFRGPILPFGVGVSYKPSRKKEIDAETKFGSDAETKFGSKFKR